MTVLEKTKIISKERPIRLFATAAMFFTLVISADNALAASTYVSLQDKYLNDRIEQLLVVSNMPVMRKPFNVQQVLHYAEQIRDSYPGLYEAIVPKLKGLDDGCDIAHAQAQLSYGSDLDTPQLLPNERGESVDSQYRVSASASCKPTDWFGVSAGVLVRDNPADEIPVDSYIVLGFDSLQLDVGYREHWASPFQSSAMLWSTNARPSISVGISNPMPFNDFWNIHYEISISELEERGNILYGNQLESGRPALLLTHLSFEPFDGWVIGLNRTMQFGGGSREVDLSLIWDAFVDPVHSDNSGRIDCGAQFVNQCELGNQQASVTSRMNFQGDVPFSLYFEYAGEDTANHENNRIGNISVSGGLFIPFLFGGNWSLNLELSEWQNEWYTHGIYRDGYTNEGVVIGHWGANERLFREKAGASSQVLKLGWQQDSNSRIEFEFRRLENEDYALYDYKVAQHLRANYDTQILKYKFGVAALVGKTVYGDDYQRLELIWKW